MSSDKISIVSFIRDLYKTNQHIPLHEPYLFGDEKKDIEQVLKENLVSTYGLFVTKFEKKLQKIIKKKQVIAVNSGTSALHLSLIAAGVEDNNYVLTQPLTFVATCNAISYCRAKPIFIDINEDFLSMCPIILDEWLNKNAIINKHNHCVYKKDGKKISACLFVNTFGHPSQSKEINQICKKWKIKTIEDGAESLGSMYHKEHVGRFSDFYTLSFNGNKIITSGSGGAVCTNRQIDAKKIRHLSTTAKKNSNKLYYDHDSVGFNYRMPNLNATLGISQLKRFKYILNRKRQLAKKYISFFESSSIKSFINSKDCSSNYWLNTIICNSNKQRNEILHYTNKNKIITRPGWILMNNLLPYRNSIISDLKNSIKISQRVLNLPSSINFK